MKTSNSAIETKQAGVMNRTDPVPPIGSRRAFLKAGVAAPMILGSGASAGQSNVFASEDLPPSPPTQPWREELPQEIAPLEALEALDPAPTRSANTGAGECGRADHQRFAELGVNPQLHELRAKEDPKWVFHPDYPAQPFWGFEGVTAAGRAIGPTIFARYGRPIITRFYNELPQNHVGFGSPELSVHLHNLHSPSESDGFPGDFFSPLKAGPTLGDPEGTGVPGRFKDHFWPNVYAGLDQFGGIGDPREALGTLFFHDHTLDFTAPNITRGVAGFYLLFDTLDSGDEHDPNPRALRLPSHPYDYPLIFQDKRFDANGIHVFDQFDTDGTLGDKITVNGRIEPVLRVAQRKYRLRLINGGPARFYRFFLVDAFGVVQPFTYIANDGNLLPHPLHNRKNVELGMGERADIVVDFARHGLGTELYLVNRLAQDSTRGPSGGLMPGVRLLKIVVDRKPPEPDVSRVPWNLRPLPPLDPAEIAAAPVRRFEFDRSGGVWTINGEVADVLKPAAIVTRGSAEIWELVNKSGGWSHPAHVHFEEGRILSKSVSSKNIPIPVHERGRKDIFSLGPNMGVRVFYRFRDFTGKYAMHCHNPIHEDHGMMIRYDIVD